MSDEPKITINGVELTEAQAMTVRVALTSFDFSLTDGSLGDDQHGKEMIGLYRERLRELYKVMRLGKKP